MRLPVSCRQARMLGLSHYFTGKICKNGHIATRRSNNWTCSECYNECRGGLTSAGICIGDIVWQGRLRKTGSMR